MIKRLCICMVGSILLLSTGGCLVSESAYLKKVEEVDLLTKDLAELQQVYRSLSQENSALKAKFRRLTEDSAGLAADKMQLEGLLKAKSDTLSKNISELRQKVAELRVENGTLSDEVAALQKVKEEKAAEVSRIYEKFIEALKDEIAQGQLTVSELKGKLTVNLEAALLFEGEKSTMKPEGVAILNKIIPTLKGIGTRWVKVEGHTDNVLVAGELARLYPSNWELSAMRAITVTRYFQDQGVDPKNLSATACAEHRPVAENSAKEGNSKNHRIEISLVAKE